MKRSGLSWLDKVAAAVSAKCDRVGCVRPWTHRVNGHPCGLCEEHAREWEREHPVD